MEGQLNLYAPDGTDASIRAAATAAIAAGGGEIRIPAGTITILSPLPIGSNLIYRGTPPKWNMNGGAVSGGTMLVGDGVAGVSPGTFSCFELNSTDGVSLPANAAAMFATGLGGVVIEDIAFTRFKYAVKFGAYRTCGIHTLRMNNVIAWDCEWGFWLENCHNLHLGNIIATDNKLGGYAHIGSMGGIWDFGNDYVENVVVHNGSRGMVTRNTKGVVIEARGPSSRINSATYDKITVIGPGSALYTQSSAAIFSNGSANIAISANIDYFAVDDVVYIGTAGSGFTLRPYFVVTNTPTGGGAGTIQLSTVKGGTPIVASGSTSSTISVKGAALLDVGGRGDATSVGGVAPTVFHCQFRDIDLEAGGTAHLAACNIQDVHFNTGIINGNTGTIEVVVSVGQKDISFDFGSEVNNVYVSSSSWMYKGLRPIALWALTSRPLGFVSSTGDLGRLNLTIGSTGDNTDKGDLYGGPAGWRALKLGNVLTHKTGSIAASQTLDVFNGNVLNLQGAETLPTIDANNAGTVYYVLNSTASAAVLTTSGGQLFDNDSGVTTYSIPAKRSAIIFAAQNGATYYWGVIPGRA